MHYQAGFVFIVSLGYAIVRYNLCGPVAWEQVPVYIFNKAISLNSVICLLLASYHQWKQDPKHTRFWGRLSFHSAMIHILLSLAILSKDYYPKFYEENLFTFAGEIVILSGVLAWYSYWLLRKTATQVVRRIQLKIVASLMIAIHVVAMGYKGWFAPQDWHGGLPPISLISFIVAIGCLVVLGLIWRNLVPNAKNNKFLILFHNETCIQRKSLSGKAQAWNVNTRQIDFAIFSLRIDYT